MITAGIDIGAKHTHGVVSIDGRVTGRAVAATGCDAAQIAYGVLDAALAAAELRRDQVAQVRVTGAGRKTADLDHGTLTEAECVARAAGFLDPEIRTVIDIGAEDARAVRIDRRGQVVDVTLNERCAAGAGGFADAAARLLECPIDELGPLALASTRAIAIDAQCVVFAESELVRLLHAKLARPDLARAVHDAIAARVVSMVRRVGCAAPVMLVGGLARNPGFVASLATALGLDAVRVPEYAEYCGALGAALAAAAGASPEPGSPRAEILRPAPALARRASTGHDRRASWRWPEISWHATGRDWRGAEIVSAGVDVGSVSSQAVVLVDGELHAWSNLRTGAGSADSADRAMARALEGTGLAIGDLHFVVGTGYGRVNVPFADKTMSEIHCHARGAHFIYGDRVRTVLDVGGQDCKAIRCDPQGKVVDFQLNDKCAAGTGRGLERFADLLGVPIVEIGPRSLEVAQESPPVSSQCVVFARTEAARWLRHGWSEDQVLAAYCGAMARRLVDLLERLGVEPALAITGGMAKNPGVVARIEQQLGCSALTGELDPQLAGALGAALFGRAREQKRRSKQSR